MWAPPKKALEKLVRMSSRKMRSLPTYLMPCDKVSSPPPAAARRMAGTWTCVSAMVNTRYRADTTKSVTAAPSWPMPTVSMSTPAMIGPNMRVPG